MVTIKLSTPLLLLSLLTGCGGGGGGGGGGSADSSGGGSATTNESLSTVPVASAFQFQQYANLTVSVDIPSFNLAGNHIFLKLYPAGIPDEVLFLGELSPDKTWQTTLSVENVVHTLVYELYSDGPGAATGSITVSEQAISLRGDTVCCG